MSAPDLQSRFPRGTPDRGGNAIGSNPLTITERRVALVQVTARKGREGELAAVLKAHWDLDLPPPCGSAVAAAHSAIWIQPNSWLLQADAVDEAVFAPRLAALLAEFAAVVDQSHGRSVLRLSGPRGRDVLAKCCRLDLHPRVFAAGRAASTLVAHVSCLLHQIDDGPTYDLVVGSTFAAWLLDELTEASAAFGWRFIRASEDAAARSATTPSLQVQTT